ncbi:MAG: hypothetical protein QOF59_2813 [Actinomycetota bacterium]|nr:hypothetical protein [Actinomycetota bacterium]MDQ1478665.1 hypothetical protein [Actinomycetota bacterium]
MRVTEQIAPPPTPVGPPPGLAGLALVVVLLAQLVVILDFSIVNVALPSIGGAFHASSTTVQWVVTAYAITFGGLLVLGGRAADVLGRRRMFVLGLLAFAIASAAGGAAPSLFFLVAARAVQGCAAALVAPAALSILTTSFPEGPRRTRVLGLYGTMASIGFVAGLVVGGGLVETVGWRGVFYVNVPVCLVAAGVASRLVPVGVAAPRTRLDAWGAALVTAGVAVLVYAPSAGADSGWTSTPFVGALALSGVLLAAFVERERRTAQPIVPLSIFRSRTLVGGNVVGLLIGAATASEVLLLSLFCQQVLGYSPLVTGLIAVPQGVAGIVRGVIAPSVVSRMGIKRFLIANTLLCAIGLALLFRFSATSQYPLLGVVLFVLGFGLTNSIFAATVAGTAGVTDDEQGLAGALVNAARQIGSAIGVSALLALATTRAANHGGSTAALADGYRFALGACVGLAVAATVVAAAVVQSRASRVHHERLHRLHLDRPWPLPELLRR